MQSQRVKYIRVSGGRWAYAILDIASGGAESFAEQGPGEVRWWSFTPAAKEREFALGLLRNGKGKEWREVLSLDV